MSPAKKFFSGNTLEQALLQAARHFQLEPEQVAYDQVERRHGFLKVRRRVVIGVDPSAPERSEAARGPEVGPNTDAADDSGVPPIETAAPHESEPAEPAAGPGDEQAPPEPVPAAPPEQVEPRGPRAGLERRGDSAEDAWTKVSRDDAIEAAHESIRRICRLGRLELEAEIEEDEGSLSVELEGEDEEELFEDRGRLLLAIQHLLPRMIRGLTGVSVACKVDSDNFHEVRAEQLRVIAQDAASEVRRERRMQTLEPMSPDERRIVHLTLADDPAVETESHGTGLFKRVAIRPIGRGRRERDSYGR